MEVGFLVIFLYFCCFFSILYFFHGFTWWASQAASWPCFKVLRRAAGAQVKGGVSGKHLQQAEIPSMEQVSGGFCLPPWEVPPQRLGDYQLGSWELCLPALADGGHLGEGGGGVHIPGHRPPSTWTEALGLRSGHLHLIWISPAPSEAGGR